MHVNEARRATCVPMATSKYAVLMAGHTNPDLEQKYGDFGQMTRSLLQGLLQDGEQSEQWDLWSTCDGHFPSAEKLSLYQVRSKGREARGGHVCQYTTLAQEASCTQGIVVTGSPNDAFSEEPNIAELRQVIARAAGNKQKILGLCFGSQAAAIALGGQAGPFAPPCTVLSMAIRQSMLDTQTDVCMYAASVQHLVACCCSMLDRITPTSPVAGRADVGLEVGSKLMEPTPAMAQQPFYVPGCEKPFHIHECACSSCMSENDCLHDAHEQACCMRTCMACQGLCMGGRHAAMPAVPT